MEDKNASTTPILGFATTIPQDQVSTELSLWTTNKKRKPDQNSMKEEKLSKKRTKPLIAPWLSPRDSWEIKKTLAVNDLGNLLIVETKFIKNRVLANVLNNKFSSIVESEYGARVTVHDCETFSKHQMILKLCKTLLDSYAFDEHWHQVFVKRRELKEGDEIALGWYTPSNACSKYMFTFSVLKRAGQSAAAPDEE